MSACQSGFSLAAIFSQLKMTLPAVNSAAAQTAFKRTIVFEIISALCVLPILNLVYKIEYKNGVGSETTTSDNASILKYFALQIILSA